tara:strand:+ start:880 stop:1560 length:681 start_codon:yes stop_codon:yes gene_type:complete
MIITANMATIPARFESAKNAINSIYDQVDKLRVYLNNFEKIPSFLEQPKIEVHQGEDLNASGKFFWALNEDEYYFTIDDDLYYPSSYVKEHLELMKEYDDNVAVTLHGKVLRPTPVKRYFQGLKESYHFANHIKQNRFVMVLGTGVTAINTNKVKINWRNFRHYYMDDVEVSMQLQAQKIPIIVRKHKAGYLKQMWTPGKSLHQAWVRDDSTHVERINSIKWKVHQ